MESVKHATNLKGPGVILLFLPYIKVLGFTIYVIWFKCSQAHGRLEKTASWENILIQDLYNSFFWNPSLYSV